MNEFGAGLVYLHIQIMKILVVEDERKLASLICKGLMAEGFTVDHEVSGKKALERVRTHAYDAIVLDIMLPERDGLSVLRLLRQEQNSVPIIIISARDAHEEVMEGLNTGADDYLTKPFFVDELAARLRAIWRRITGTGSNIMSVADLSVNLLTRQVKRGDVEISLPNREFNLLIFMMKSPGRVYNRIQMFEHVWEYHFDPETNLVDVYIGRLRRKIDDGFSEKLIETIRGVGYRIRNL